MNTSYHSPELIHQLTRIVVFESGYLHPQEIIDKQLAYYESKHWKIEDIPSAMRKLMPNYFREPDIKDGYLRSFMGAVIQATGSKAVAFVNQIERIAIVENDICLFFNKNDERIKNAAKWFFRSPDIDKKQMAMFYKVGIVLTNTKQAKPQAIQELDDILLKEHLEKGGAKC